MVFINHERFFMSIAEPDSCLIQLQNVLSIMAVVMELKLGPDDSQRLLRELVSDSLNFDIFKLDRVVVAGETEVARRSSHTGVRFVTQKLLHGR